MPGEHFLLKDLPFYERAREADAKACQERLDQREETDFFLLELLCNLGLVFWKTENCGQYSMFVCCSS